MSAKTIANATGLLIATLAIAIVPSAAAEPPAECVVQYTPIVGENPDGDTIPGCMVGHVSACQYRFDGLELPEWLVCLALGE